VVTVLATAFVVLVVWWTVRWLRWELRDLREQEVCFRGLPVVPPRGPVLVLRPSAPPLTEDDLIAFGLALERSDDVLQELLLRSG
jgi:hypothetical protein